MKEKERVMEGVAEWEGIEGIEESEGMEGWAGVGAVKGWEAIGRTSLASLYPLLSLIPSIPSPHHPKETIP